MHTQNIRTGASNHPMELEKAITQKLEDIIDSVATKKSNADLYPLSTALLLLSKLFHTSPVNTVGEFFSSQLSPEQRSFACAYLCRLHAFRADTFTVEKTATAKLISAVYQSAPKEFIGAVGLNAKNQTYEQIAVISSFVSSLEKDLEQIIESLSELSSYGSFRQNFFQKFRPKPNQFILRPFLAITAPDVRFGEIFTQVEEYLNESGPQKLDLYEKAKDSLEDLRSEAALHPTKYSKYVKTVAEKILSLIQENFEKSPHVKPADLEVFGTDKRYPLSEIGTKFNLSFIVRNKGPGHAFDLQFDLIDVSGLHIHGARLFLGDLGAGERVVETTASVSNLVEDIISVGKITWRQFNGQIVEKEFYIPLASQKCDLDWSALRKEEPYALEPVANESQLVGRESILEQLLSQAGSQSVVSSLIIGQKRVGKTSIVRTFQSAGENHIKDACFIYLESGDYISPSAETTVADLGARLCRSIKDALPQLNSLEIPEFADSLAPLSRFLTEVTRITPTRKFIFILDEFDELPLALYKRSNVGDALFLTIRSISGKPPYGFILAGSEKLNLILSYQGEKLNKFAQYNVDYFDRDKEWASYSKLVRNPVNQWLDIEDAAIVRLYDETAGNPFFTKLICRELFRLMVTRRDRHVTTREVDEAILLTVNVASTVSFQHFWDDGILELGEKKEEISLKRRKMLIAFTDSTRSDGSVGKNSLRDAAEKYGVDSVAFEEYIREFQTRNIWLLSEGFITCKVPLFYRWLKLTGVKSIITSIFDPEAAIAHRREQEEARVTSAEIVQLVSKFGTFKGLQITEDKIRTWLNQFGSNPRTQRLMFSLLERLRFYNGALIREKMREAQTRVAPDAIFSREKLKRSDILISYLDSPGKSGAYYAKLYADENNIYFDNVIEPYKISERVKADSVSLLLFVDDLLGTGQTAAKGIEKILTLNAVVFSEKKITVALFAVCGFSKAKEVIERAAASHSCPVKVLVGDVLSDSDKAFNETSDVFKTIADREDAKTSAYAEGKKLEPKCPLGFNDSQALVVFESSCPNNTLPIIWSRNKDWVPLFPRT